LQAQINAGASKAEILAGAGQEEIASMPATSALTMSTVSAGTGAASATSVVSKVLASHKIQTKPIIAPVMPVAQPIVAPIAAAPEAAAPSSSTAETKAS
jgi:hypothetical protein